MVQHGRLPTNRNRKPAVFWVFPRPMWGEIWHHLHSDEPGVGSTTWRWLPLDLYHPFRRSRSNLEEAGDTGTCPTVTEVGFERLTLVLWDVRLLTPTRQRSTLPTLAQPIRLELSQACSLSLVHLKRFQKNGYIKIGLIVTIKHWLCLFEKIFKHHIGLKSLRKQNVFWFTVLLIRLQFIICCSVGSFPVPPFQNTEFYVWFTCYYG